MKTIKIKQKDFDKMLWLYDKFYEIYGNKNTAWSLSNLDEMRIIGQEFMEKFFNLGSYNKHIEEFSNQ